MKLPWWGVSILLHLLIVIAAGMTAGCVAMPDEYDVLYTPIVTPIEPPRPSPSTSDIGLPSHLMCEPDEYVTFPTDFSGQDGDPDQPRGTSELQDEGQDFLSRDGARGTDGTGSDSSIGIALEANAGADWGTGEDFGAKLASGDPHEVGGPPRLMVSRVHETAPEIVAALDWLARHQDCDGHWDAMKNGAEHKTDTAITGLALLALLRAGHTERAGKYQRHVRLAVDWLKRHQWPDGLIFDETDSGAHRGVGYPMAIATLALCEATALSNNRSTRTAAQWAVDCCVAHQSGDASDKLGWRYSAGQSGDTSVTGWYVMALAAARSAKLKVDPAAFDGAVRFFESVDVRDTHNCSISHFAYRPNEEHAESAHRLTSIGTLALLNLGVPKESLRPTFEAAVAQGGTPRWSNESVDLYYWYYATQAAAQIGDDAWQQWGRDLATALNTSRITEGPDQGSWPVIGAYSDEWGRVGQTALACLCLEVYYRYERVK